MLTSPDGIDMSMARAINYLMAASGTIAGEAPDPLGARQGFSHLLDSMTAANEPPLTIALAITDAMSDGMRAGNWPVDPNYVPEPAPEEPGE